MITRIREYFRYRRIIRARRKLVNCMMPHLMRHGSLQFIEEVDRMMHYLGY